MNAALWATVGGDERRARMAWSHLLEPVADPGQRSAAVRLAALVTERGALDCLRALAAGRLADAAGCQPRLAALDLDAHLRAHDRLGVDVLVPGDATWPAGVDDLPAPPHCLYVRGPLDLSVLSEVGIAVVGARACTAYGGQVARSMAADLADRGMVIVSGGAFGIDAAAHQGALAVGAPTVAVLACGLDRFYPQANTALLEQVLATGALVSELPLGCAPYRQRFLARNRLIAAMTKGTVVVEASPRSGSLSTAGRALELDRHVAMVPGPVTSTLSVGCHDWIRARDAALVTDAADVLDLMGRIGEDAQDLRRGEQTTLDLIEPGDRDLYSAVPIRGGADLAHLARSGGLSVAATLAGLGRLSLMGLVERREDRWVKTRTA